MFRLLPTGAKTVLCLGAHCDDIEIGCGGTILRLLAEEPEIDVLWVALSSDATRAAEAQASAAKFLAKARSRKVVIKSFKNGFFPFRGEQIKEYFEQLKSEVSPDVVFTHFRDDRHQDHRIVSELTWNTFRRQLILEYEVPKYDGDLGTPNLFVPLSDAARREKVATIMECFASQREKHWFTADLFTALMRLRGMECNAPEGHAEAFYCRKAVVGR